jgi:hypothetical protein
MNGRRYCPVCHNRVWPTRGHNIAPHRDKAGNLCCCYGEPYDITITTDDNKQ